VQTFQIKVAETGALNETDILNDNNIAQGCIDKGM